MGGLLELEGIRQTGSLPLTLWGLLEVDRKGVSVEGAPALVPPTWKGSEGEGPLTHPQD